MYKVDCLKRSVVAVQPVLVCKMKTQEIISCARPSNKNKQKKEKEQHMLHYSEKTQLAA